MMRKLPWVLFAVSLVFNVMFLAARYGVAARLERARSPGGAEALAMDRLGLDQAQRDAFRRLRDRVREAVMENRQRNDLAVASFWEEMAEEQPNPDRVSALLEEMAGHVNRQNQVYAGAALELMRNLSAEQRETFRRMLREHRIFRYLKPLGGKRERPAPREREPVTFEQFHSSDTAREFRYSSNSV